MHRTLGQFLAYLPSDVIDIGLKVLKKIRLRKGRHVFDHEWDVLVVLDACRYDMYESVVGSGEPVLSLASTSTEWMRETFAEKYSDEVQTTAYISANPYSKILDKSRFGLMSNVWQNHWDDELGTIPPASVTDYTISAARTGEYDRVIAHYMQPHFPFIGGEKIGTLGRSAFNLGESEGKNVWRMVDRGDIDPEVAIEGYYDNLRRVFEEVEILLENIDGKVVITADHANALGEWNLWGHRAYVPFRAVREVPWDERICEDKRTYVPDVNLQIEEGDAETDGLKKRLEALGYIDE